MPKEITSWQAEDGTLHDSEIGAMHHETAAVLLKSFPELKTLITSGQRFKDLCLAVLPYARLLEDQRKGEPVVDKITQVYIDGKPVPAHYIQASPKQRWGACIAESNGEKSFYRALHCIDEAEHMTPGEKVHDSDAPTPPDGWAYAYSFITEDSDHVIMDMYFSSGDYISATRYEQCWPKEMGGMARFYPDVDDRRDCAHAWRRNVPFTLIDTCGHCGEERA